MKQRELSVMCKNESQLIQVSGYKNKYFKTDGVDLLDDSLRSSPIYCMWKKKCTIKIRRKGLKRRKRWFENNMRCLKKDTKIYDLISKETSEKDAIRELGEQTTIVRSQRNFPWNYLYCYADLIYSLKFKTYKKHINSTLALRVLWSDINKIRGDHLVIQHGNDSKNIRRGSDYLEIAISDLKHIKLEFKTNFVAHENCVDSGSRGFLICMKIVSSMQNNSICDEVMDKVSAQTFIKQNKRGKKRRKRNRRRKKGKRNKKSEKRNRSCR
ncbi:uncharacterized protein LOC133192729 [Saccostrea echinata]|uniref:uncharacterized protein LOC133192729 n=1 Tax=Saccostrea echinata TaxID=191078 RepID=UPI002A839ED3|nr:uncharacterized protein LOC133192729 [Saccostrea echinata]